MRRWLRPDDLPQLGGWDLWRLREIGAWGDVGRILGTRWEEIGGTALVERFGDAIVPLWRDRALGRWLGTLGLPNPDAVLVERDGRKLRLRPIDLKWAVDTATHAQIAGATLEALVVRAGERLASRLPGRPDEWELGDGLFATPVRQLNRLFVRSRANLAGERSIWRSDLLEIPVDVVAFFRPLPGWATAERLGGLERSADLTRDLEVADRYFHLGVGIRGALAARDRSLFDERPDASDDALLRVDPSADERVSERLEGLLREIDVPSIRAVVRRLSGLQAERQALRQRLRALERSSYRFGAFMGDVRRAGMAAAEEDEAGVARLREIFREIQQVHATQVRALGRELVLGGLRETDALDAIEGELPDLARRAHERARAALRELKATG